MSLPIVENESVASQPTRFKSHAFSGIIKKILPRASSSTKIKIDDDRYDHFITDQVDDYPEGYPQLASFITSDIDTKLFRRFSYLRTRLLLNSQSSLTKLEKQLSELDEKDGAHEEDHMLLRSIILDRREDGNTERVELLKDIGKTLAEYDELLLRENSIAQIRKASRGYHLNLFNWVWNEQPLVKQDMSFIFHRDDFVALGMGEDSWFLGFTHKIRLLIPDCVSKYLFSPRKHEANAEMDNVEGYSNAKLALFAKVLLAFASTGFLVLPCIILFLIEMSKAVRVSVSCTFVLFFALAIAIFTKAKLHEVFAATAAYAAVIVVFLGTQQNSA